jgi:hypothetical protein
MFRIIRSWRFSLSFTEVSFISWGHQFSIGEGLLKSIKEVEEVKASQRLEFVGWA